MTRSLTSIWRAITAAMKGLRPVNPFEMSWPLVALTWQTLTDIDRHWPWRTSLNNEWMDVVSAIVTSEARMFSLCGWQLFFCRQWRRSSARMQPSSVWTWRNVESMMLGWRPGGRIWLQWRAPAMKDPGVGPKIAWSRNAADYVWVWLWRCWGGFLWQVIVVESLAFTMPGALRKARRQVLFVDCGLLQAYNATHLMREDMLHFVYETVVGAACRALPQVALNARDLDAMQSFVFSKDMFCICFCGDALNCAVFFWGGVLSWRLRNVCKTVFSRNVLKKYVGEICSGSVINDCA